MKFLCCFGVLFFFVLAVTPLSSAVTASPTTLTLDINLGPDCLGPDLYQMAVWLEDSEGRFVDTLYVTDATGREGLGNSYMSFLGITIRSVPGCLPVWAYKRGVLYGKSHYPPKDHPLPDAITGATIKQEHALKTFNLKAETLAKLPGGVGVCCVEINVSRDSIPSMVFKCPLPVDANNDSTLAFVGCGNEKGQNGSLTPGIPRNSDPTTFIKTAHVHMTATPIHVSEVQK